MNLINRLLCTCRRRWLLLLGIVVCIIVMTLRATPDDFSLISLLTKNP